MLLAERGHPASAPAQREPRLDAEYDFRLIYSAERDLIRNRGLDAFEALTAKAELSLADVRRPPLTVVESHGLE